MTVAKVQKADIDSGLVDWQQAPCVGLSKASHLLLRVPHASSASVHSITTHAQRATRPTALQGVGGLPVQHANAHSEFRGRVSPVSWEEREMRHNYPLLPGAFMSHR